MTIESVKLALGQGFQDLTGIKQIKELYSLRTQKLPTLEGLEEEDPVQCKVLLTLQASLHEAILKKEKELQDKAIEMLKGLLSAMSDPNARTENNINLWCIQFLNQVNQVGCYQNQTIELFDALDALRTNLKQVVKNNAQFKSVYINSFLLEAFIFDNAIHELRLKAQKALGPEKMEPIIVSFFELKNRFLQTHFTGEDNVYLTSLINEIAEVIQEQKTNLLNSGQEFPQIAEFFAKEQQTIAIPKRLCALESVILWMNKIKDKYKEFKKQGERSNDARDAADACWQKINQLNKKYSYGHISLVEYKKEATKAIDAAHDVLDKHRGCKEILINLAIAIFTLGLGYLLMVAYKGRFFPLLPVKTDSEEKLDHLQTAVEAMAGPGF